MNPVVDHIVFMLHKGIIEPCMSQWSSSIVFIPKKTREGSVKYRFCVDYRALNFIPKGTREGSVKYRFCVDYRALNAVTKPDAYPIPNVVDTLD
jgi:hypothetical protein